VNPYHKPQSLLDLNPRGLVPTLQYQNKPLYESTVLCEFLEEAFPDRPPHLLPKDPYDRARTRIWTDYVGSRIIPAYHRFLQHQGQDGLKEKQQDFLDHLKEFTKEMDPEGPYFMGKEFSLIDIVIAPWANRLWVFDHFKGGSGLPEEGQGGDDEKTWSRWRTWLKAVESRKSVRETLSDREHYLPIYQRYGKFPPTTVVEKLRPLARLFPTLFFRGACTNCGFFSCSRGPGAERGSESNSGRKGHTVVERQSARFCYTDSELQFLIHDSILRRGLIVHYAREPMTMAVCALRVLTLGQWRG
jgi:glutathione S-transferase